MESEESVSDAVAQAVGERVRYWRTERGLLMRQLADAAGVKQPFLSKIEKGDASPSMLSLYRIATALDVTPGDLLPAVAPRPGPTIVRGGEGRQIAGTEASTEPIRFIGSTDAHVFEISEMEFDHARQNDEWFDYPSPAATYVISGAFDVVIEGLGTYNLEPGDTIFYPAKSRVRWQAAGRGSVRVLHIVARQRQS